MYSSVASMTLASIWVQNALITPKGSWYPIGSHSVFPSSLETTGFLPVSTNFLVPDISGQRDCAAYNLVSGFLH